MLSLPWSPPPTDRLCGSANLHAVNKCTSIFPLLIPIADLHKSNGRTARPVAYKVTTLHIQSVRASKEISVNQINKTIPSISYGLCSPLYRTIEFQNREYLYFVGKSSHMAAQPPYDTMGYIVMIKVGWSICLLSPSCCFSNSQSD